MKHFISEADLAFKSQFESCEFLVAEFDHKAHLRLAYIYLCENDTDASVGLVRNALKRFLEHNKVDPAKYHETLTKAWVLAIHHFMNKTDLCHSAEAFIAKNPIMLNPKIMMTHYTKEVLFSDEARKGFVQPNLEPIPLYSCN